MKISSFILPFASAVLLSLLTTTAFAEGENVDKLWQEYDDYLEESNDAITIERYSLAKRIALAAQNEEGDRELINLYDKLSETDRNIVEKEHFNYLPLIQKRHQQNNHIQTDLCWSSLLHNQISFAELACKRAYELNFMYPPATINMAHIAYSNGDESKAKALVNQSLVSSSDGRRWSKIAKEDFTVLSNIYSVEAKEQFQNFIDNELNSSWYQAYRMVSDKHLEALYSDSDTQTLFYLNQIQRLISKRFGEDSLINAYYLTQLARAEYMLDPMNENIFTQQGLTAENSTLVQESLDFL